MKLARISIIALLNLVSPMVAMSDVFDASAYPEQNDLYYGLTDSFTHKVYPSVDTLRFIDSADSIFVLNRHVTPGASAPAQLTDFDENRAYQNLIFENRSTRNKWMLSAREISGANPALAADLSTKSLTLTNTTLGFETRTRVFVNHTDYVKNLILDNGANGANGGMALLALNDAHIETASSLDTKIRFGSDALIRVSGRDNRISTPGGALMPSFYRLELRLDPDSVLNLSGSEVRAESYGQLTLERGSTLNISDSNVFLTRVRGTVNKIPESSATIDTAMVSIEGLYGDEPAGLFLSEPRITNSLIRMGNNNRFLSLQKSPLADFVDGDFHFNGNNSISLQSGALIAGWANDSDSVAGFYFSGGTTLIEGSGGLSSVVRALDITLEKAHLEYKNINFGSGGTDDDLMLMTLRDKSTLTNTEGVSQFKKLKYMRIDDSVLSGAFMFSEDAILNAKLNNATLRLEHPDRTSSMAFYLKGIDGFGEENKAKITFTGRNTIISRIDPNGTDVGVSQNIVTGVKSYSDAIYFTRINSFSDNAAPVTGLGTLTAQLEPFAAGLTAQAYAMGGKEGNGVYDVLLFTGDGAAPATADGDVVAVSLSGAMPALLTATQVAKPSVDGKVSYKLSVDLNQLQAQSGSRNQSSLAQALTLTPSVLPSEGSTGSANAVALTEVHQAVKLESGASLATALSNLSQSHWSRLGEQHAEPYASFMTVSLEQNLMLANMVMDRAAGDQRLLNRAMSPPAPEGPPQRLDHLEHMAGPIWGDLQYAKGRVDAQHDLAGYDYQLGALVLGVKSLQSDEAAFGFFTGLNFSKLTGHDVSNASFQSLGFHLGAYGRQKLLEQVNVMALAGVNHNAIDSSRVIPNVGGFQGGNARGAYNSSGAFAGLRLERLFELMGERSHIKPVFEISYAKQLFRSVSETGGGDLGFNVGAGQADALVGALGLHASHAWTYSGRRWAIDALFRYEYDFFASSKAHHALNMQSQLTGHEATVYGLDRGARGLTAGVGLNVSLNEHMSLSMAYRRAGWSHGRQQQFGAAMTLKW